jgi:Common central domain of tyrosinase/Bacterial Ig domain
MKIRWSVQQLVILTSVMFATLGLMQLQGRVAAQPNGPDLFIRDTSSDTGIEPNPDTGAMWLSQDLWVRRTPDPNYDPHPFPVSSPAWTPAAHENPLYRSYRKATPNYVYVRVINRGTAASSGTERLKANWARASTGLAWPAQWVDNTASPCGAVRAFGGEITKPRINAATASAADRAKYVQAFLNVNSTPIGGAGTASYWATQKVIHGGTGSGDGDIDVPQHFMETFLPWHREFINRLELLMQESDPTVKLMYWDWVTNPNPVLGFMGSFSGTNTAAPFSALPTFNRAFDISNLPAASTNGSIQAKPWFLGQVESQNDFLTMASNPMIGMSSHLEYSSHGNAHLTIGGDQGTFAGAGGDPFFFLIHGNADRLFAKWQRANVDRLVKSTLYQNTNAALNLGTNPELENRQFKPWNGQGFGTAINPWSGSASPLAVVKTSTDRSVISPPIYDDAPLTIPALAPGEAVVMEIPWYPPNPEDLTCLGAAELRHYCLLARIETGTGSPFGMTSPEGVDVNINTRNNNNIAWRNVQVENEFPGMTMRVMVMLRNTFSQNVATGIRVTEIGQNSFLRQGQIDIKLPAFFQQQWLEGQRRGQSIEFLPRSNAIRVFKSNAEILGLTLPPKALVPVEIEVRLNEDYKPGPDAVTDLLVTQLGAPEKPEAIIGGQMVRLDFRKLRLIPQGTEWRFSTAQPSDSRWQSSEFDDSVWTKGRSSLGFGIPVETVMNAGNREQLNTAYFRKSFNLEDAKFVRELWLRLKRDDGAVVYLNGKEVMRSNMPAGAVNGTTAASNPVRNASANNFYPFKLNPKMLVKGKNTIAVEVHQSRPGDEDLIFDLELIANPDSMQDTPKIAFSTPTDGSGWQANERKTISFDVADGLAKIRQVALFIDNKPIDVRSSEPFSFIIPTLESGKHQIRAVVTNSKLLSDQVQANVFVATNTPPKVSILSPTGSTMIGVGGTVEFKAQADDASPGSVKKLEFFVQGMQTFNEKPVLIKTVEGKEGSVQVKDLGPGMYMLQVIATDDQGLRSPTENVHLHVH